MCLMEGKEKLLNAGLSIWPYFGDSHEVLHNV